MHNALLVRELAHYISQYCYEDDPRGRGSLHRSQGTLASLALTCKTLNGPATEVLWQHIPSVGHLLDLLPSDLWSAKLHREVTLSDIASLKRCAAHARSLEIIPNIFDWATITRDIEAFAVVLQTLRPQDVPLFPKIRKATIWLGKELTAKSIASLASSMMGSTLKELTLNIEEMPMSERLVWLQAFAASTPGLTNLDFSEFTPFYNTLEPNPWQSLQSVNGTSATLADMKTILRLPHLQSLCIRIAYPFIDGDSTAEELIPTCRLRSLELKNAYEDRYPVPTFKRVLDCLTNAPLDSLVLDASMCDGFVYRDDYDSLISTISNCGKIDVLSLKKLEISASCPGLWDVDEGAPTSKLDPYRLSLFHDFVNLEELSVMFDRPQVTAVGPIIDLGDHIPNLKTLKLGYQQYGKVLGGAKHFIPTLDDLVPIARAFPKLETLHIPMGSASELAKRLSMDGSGRGRFEDSLPRPGGWFEQCNLSELHIGEPELHTWRWYTGTIAGFLSQTFPSLKSLEIVWKRVVDESDEESDWDDDGERENPWLVIASALGHIYRGREIERRRIMAKELKGV